MPMPTAAVTSDATRAVVLTACSYPRGMNSTAASPTSGMNTARVNAQSSNQCMACRYLASEDIRQEHGEAQQAHTEEEHERVPLHASGLDSPDLAARRVGLVRESVDRAVHPPLVDHVVGVPSQHCRAPPDAVHDPVDDV